MIQETFSVYRQVKYAEPEIEDELQESNGMIKKKYLTTGNVICFYYYLGLPAHAQLSGKCKGSSLRFCCYHNV